MADPNATLGFRLRVCYQKAGRLKYLAHLEVLRSVERIVRRAKLPYAITQGFSPHMKIAYSAALPVGVASEEEYFDVWLTEYIPAEELLPRLQAAAPPNLMVKAASFVGLKEKSLTAALTISVYTINLITGNILISELKDAINDVLSQGYIEYLRKDKVKRVALENKIAAPVELAQEGDTITLHLVTRSSNEGALRPDVFMDAVADKILEARNAEVISKRAQEFLEQGVPLSSSRERVFESCTFLRVEQLEEEEDGTWRKPLAPTR